MSEQKEKEETRTTVKEIKHQKKQKSWLLVVHLPFNGLEITQAISFKDERKNSAFSGVRGMSGWDTEGRFATFCFLATVYIQKIWVIK